MKSRLSELSALYDGELETHESQAIVAVVRAAAREEQMRAAWHAYALSGDCLRGGQVDTPDISASVMARINAEPVVLAPRNVALPARHQPWLALAASVAGVAVVGWLAIAGNQQVTGSDSGLAAVSPAPTFAVSAVSVATAPTQALAKAPDEHARPAHGDISEYLLAHQTQASSFRLGDATHQIRTVSLVGNPHRP